jgi:hypothetical protein
VNQISTVSYKGFSITADPHQHPDSKEWNINISIGRNTGAHVGNKPFSTGDFFKTKEEAIQQCIGFGRRIIDGEFDNFAVSDL